VRMEEKERERVRMEEKERERVRMEVRERVRMEKRERERRLNGTAVQQCGYIFNGKEI
jgi:hypothetical protein